MITNAAKESSKKKQLKTVFKTLITDMFGEIGSNLSDAQDNAIINETIKLMVKEVSMRTSLK